MLGGGILASYYDMIRQVLERSIRRVQLKVHWKEGAVSREVTVVSYFTDDRYISQAASGSLSPAGLNTSGTSGTGGTATSGSSGAGSPSTAPAMNTGGLKR